MYLIPENLNSYDAGLQKKTGLSLKGLGLEAAGLKESAFARNSFKVAVIPVTAGQGTITFFVEAVRKLAEFVGFSAFITKKPDVGGLAEAYQAGADLIMLADDHLYTAINLHDRRVIDNDEATALGYTTALDKMAGGLREKKVLLIGAGPVGRAAAKLLACRRASLIIYDQDRARQEDLAALIRKKYAATVTADLSLKEALSLRPLIFDASTGKDLVRAEDVGPQTFVAAPGIPFGFDEAAKKKVEDRLIHDCLEIGTAVMLFLASA